jgi:hypothetical protein
LTGIDGGERREFLAQIRSALVTRARQLMREQIVTGHEIQDLVEFADIAEKHACRDG